MTAQQTAHDAPVSLQDARILVVADNVPSFVLIARLLAQIGVSHCEWKTSGWQVVQFADALPALDLILLDIRLPYEDGYQRCASCGRTAPARDPRRRRERRRQRRRGTRAREAGFAGSWASRSTRSVSRQIRRLLDGDPSGMGSSAG